jgi:hypothetical protein
MMIMLFDLTSKTVTLKRSHDDLQLEKDSIPVGCALGGQGASHHKVTQLTSQLHTKLKLRVISNQHTALHFGKGTTTDPRSSRLHVHRVVFLLSCS